MIRASQSLSNQFWRTGARRGDRVAAMVLGATLTCVVLACSGGDGGGADGASAGHAHVGAGAGGDGAPISRASQPILRGDLDTQHPQVMLLASRTGFLCTGTLIHVDGPFGYLLTAAHCATEEDDERAVVPLSASELIVVPGDDFAEPSTAFSVDAVSVEPRYDGTFATDDVAVIRFLFGGNPAPAAIPPLSSSEDALAVDDPLLLVGYGQTESEEENTTRRRVERNIGDLDATLVAYSQEDGKGACFGDSGGPALVSVNGQERVAAVISGGVDSDDRCSGGFGVATRVSAYEAFIAAALAED